MNEVGYSEEHEAYIREHRDIQPDEDYEMNLSVLDRKKLWAKSVNKCSICNCTLIIKDDINIGEECHICSEKPNWPSKEFTRYIKSLKKKDRDSYDNAILLCSICHKIIDSPTSVHYTIDELHRIKEKHEADVKKGVTKQTSQESKQIENHTGKLKEIIQIWQQKLPKIELAEETGNPNKFHKFDISFIDDIENSFLFKVGDVFYHCDDLKPLWNSFKITVTKYRLEKQILFNEIKEYIKQELTNRNFNIKSDILEGFYITVYRAYILRAKKEIGTYNYPIYDYPDPTSINYIGKEGLKYQLSYSWKAEGGGFLLDNSSYIAETRTQEQLKDVRDFHTELINDCRKQYIEKSKKLMEIEYRLEKCKTKLSDSLEKVWHSSFSKKKMDCEFVKEGK